MGTRGRILTTLFAIGLTMLGGTRTIAPAGAQDAAPIAGTAAVSGTVEAPRPFKAAPVHLMNVDKNVLFMVYTSGGRYRAVNLFPGRYEVTVRKPGFAAETKSLALAVGAKETLNFSLREEAAQPVQQGAFGFSARIEGATLVSYDELYPAGPGRDLVEKTCVNCHGKNFLPSRPYHETQWTHFVDLMLSPTAPRGAMIPAGTFSAKDRETVIAYLARNYGPTSTKRALKVDAEFPVDETVLGKAMYIEYYLPLDRQLDAANKQRRTQEPHFDSDGNVWYTDRSIPNRIGRVDPRTAEFKDFTMPDSRADPHGLTVDRAGHVFWAETVGFHLGRLDPKTGSMIRYPMDSTGRSQGARGHTPIVDSKDNVWFTVIGGDMLGKWDRKTETARVWKVPTSGAAPYGIALDRDENVWFAEFRRGRIARFDPRTEKFTEYDARTQPTTIRRLGVDSAGVVWYGGFSSGKLGKLDPKTGRIVEYDIPMPFSEPYDVWPDRHDQIWISDGGQGGSLIRFDPRTEKFTYYPTPQTTDQPKLAITRDGAIWYTPRSSVRAAAGVLYPDVGKMTTFGAYY